MDHQVSLRSSFNGSGPFALSPALLARLGASAAGYDNSLLVTTHVVQVFSAGGYDLGFSLHNAGAGSLKLDVP